MRARTPRLIAILESDEFLMADLYTFSLVPGATVIRLTTADRDLVVGGDTYLTAGERYDGEDAPPCIERSTCSWKCGVEVGELEIQLYPELSNLILGVPWLTAARYGYLDGGEITYGRAFTDSWLNPPESLALFSGRVAAIDGGAASGLHLTAKDWRELLNMMMPRNTYQAGCTWTLYGPGCGVDREAFTVSGAVGEGATVSSIPIPDTAKADGWFDQGVLSMDGGLTRRAIKRWEFDTATLITPLLAAPALGALVDLVPGCDKTLSTCEDKFDNRAAFRGCPFVPEPEVAT